MRYLYDNGDSFQELEKIDKQPLVCCLASLALV